MPEQNAFTGQKHGFTIIETHKTIGSSLGRRNRNRANDDENQEQHEESNKSCTATTRATTKS